jgi:lipopolysaccharide export LptBFGC system permease protein LptF
MNIFDRYLLTNFLKIFLTVSFASITLTVLYSLTDLFFGFKEKRLDVGLSYILYLIPVGFYILSSLLVGVSLLVLFRRVFYRRTDLTVQSFGISPLRFSSVLILSVLGLSLLLMTMNESFIPGLFKRLWYIEKTYKKKQEIGRLVERLWFVKETHRGRHYVYINSLDVFSGRFAGLFMLLVSPGGKVSEVIEGRRGRWVDNVIQVDEGSAYNFREGFFVRRLSDFSLKTEIALSEVGLFAEKIQHVSTSSLMNLYVKGSKLGLDANRYLSEVLYRVGMSLLPFWVAVPLLRSLLKHRSLKSGALSFFIHLVAGWMLSISPKMLADKAGLPPQYALPLYLLFSIYLLKGVYDLHKGFRI